MEVINLANKGRRCQHYEIKYTENCEVGGRLGFDQQKILILQILLPKICISIPIGKGIGLNYELCYELCIGIGIDKIVELFAL